MKALSNKVDTCINRLNDWINKLDGTDDRTSQENPVELEQLMTKDSILMESAFECRGELENFYKSLEDMLSALSQSLSLATEADNEMS